METLNRIWRKFGNHSTPEKASTISHIACFGFANTKPGEKLYQDAFAVAYELAKAGYTIVNGGGPGVMQATTMGAKAAGSQVIGVTFYPHDATNFEGRDLGNPIDTEIKTNNYVERTVNLMKQGQVYVVFNGSTGTLSEFAMAWGLAELYFGHHKPLILYGKFWNRILKSIECNMKVRPEEKRVYKVVDTPQKVLRAIKQFEDEIVSGEIKALITSKEIGPFTLNV